MSVVWVDFGILLYFQLPWQPSSGYFQSLVGAHHHKGVITSTSSCQTLQNQCQNVFPLLRAMLLISRTKLWWLCLRWSTNTTQVFPSVRTKLNEGFTVIQEWINLLLRGMFLRRIGIMLRHYYRCGWLQIWLHCWVSWLFCLILLLSKFLYPISLDQVLRGCIGVL